MNKASGKQDSSRQFTTKDGVPFFKTGLPHGQVSFSGGRIATNLAEHGGLTRIIYFGGQHLGAVEFFNVGDVLSGWHKLYRIFAVIDGKMFFPTFSNTLIYPHGYTSECTLDNVRFKHSMALLNDTIVLSCEVLKNPGNKKIQLKLVNNDACNQVAKTGREWKERAFDCKLNALIQKVMDSAPPKKDGDEEALTQKAVNSQCETATAVTTFGISSTSKLSCRMTPDVFKKTYLETEPFKKTCSFYLLFAPESSFDKRLLELKRDLDAELRRLDAGFQIRMKDQPSINVGDKLVESLFAMCGSAIDSMKVKDMPGGMRAADSGYWVWGWDSMVHSDAILLWGDRQFVQDMLKFYRDTASPTHGIAHAFTTTCKPFLAMAPAAQTLYCVMLYNHFLYTGDKRILQEYFSFSENILERALKDAVGNSGLYGGVSLYPDFPEHLEQDGHDISVFNNGIVYQALRCMAALSAQLGQKEKAARLEEKAARLKKAFLFHFYDQGKGFFVDSVSAKDFTRRYHYPSYAILWLTPFAGELIDGVEKPVARFMRENFKHARGFSMLPKWDTRFMWDGNQLGMYMPVVERFYWEAQKQAGVKVDTDWWFNLLGWFWNQLTIPEALSCEAENEGVAVDNLGRKQAFCAKGWYSIFIHDMAGVEFHLGSPEITISPMASREINISNLKFRKKKLSIRIAAGKKGCIRKITV
ncbi:MAG: hypothetical protein WAX69_01710 [Victivallales bacterium]